MVGNRSSKWDAAPKRFCVRAKAADGCMVTLGRYETAEQAEAERATFAGKGEYRDVTVQPIAPKPAPAE